jgi:hypothetical protein
MSGIKEELASFHNFALGAIESEAAPPSLETLLTRWRQACEYQATVDDIQHGLADHDAGLGRPLAEVADEVRRELGLTS